MTALFSLNTLVLLGIVVAAAVAVLIDNILASVISLGVASSLLALEFIVLHAPDVAISEAAVGAILTTVIFIVAIRRTTKKGDEDK